MNWAFLALPVKKKDGGLRIVIDYRKLNAVTVKKPFYMPTIEEVVGKLSVAKFIPNLTSPKDSIRFPLNLIL